MRVAFYAPLKPPDHPVPSGDRQMARLLITALERAGHDVALASRLRSRDARGDASRQARLKAIGAALAARLLKRYRREPPDRRPQVWLTYHLYYKAPDWIGPAVVSALGIPYIVVEASVAAKRAGGAWDAGHRATLAALDRAGLIIVPNPNDAAALPHKDRIRPLKPFLDETAFSAAARQRQRHRQALAERYRLDPARPWILAAAMMRHGDKLASFRLLAPSLAHLEDMDWQLLIVGDGPARPEVEACLETLDADRLRFAGQVAGHDLPAVYAACDLLAWPAVNEAYGMALLEAQAAGLPVVAGAVGGVPEIVRDGTSGLLCPPGDAQALGRAIRGLLEDAGRRRRMSAAALSQVGAEHTLAAASRRLDELLREAIATS